MLRNKLSIIGYTVLLSITCVSLVACGNNDDSGENKNPVHDTSKWFTEEELSLKGLTFDCTDWIVRRDAIKRCMV